MIIKELIDLLKKEDPKKLVVVRGYEDGVNSVSGIETIKIKLNVNKDIWYLGNHEEIYDKIINKKNFCEAIQIC